MFTPEEEQGSGSCGPSISNRAHDTFVSKGLTIEMISRIDDIKKLAAQLWDQIDSIPVAPGNSTAGRLVSLAKTDLENTVMWASKACSRFEVMP